MTKPLFLILFLFTASFSTPGSAQNADPVFKHFTTDEGFPSSQVYEAMQDAAGYMWFATDRGLVRYNGYEFKVFTAKDGLTDNVVFRLFQDDKKRIWMITFSGSIFVFENNKITPYKYNSKINYLIKGSDQQNIYVDNFENVFAGSASGLYMIDSTGTVTQRFKYSGIVQANKLIIDQQNSSENPIAIGSVNNNFLTTDLFNITSTGRDSLRVSSSLTGRLNAIRLKNKVMLVAIGRNLFEFKNKSLTPLATIPAEILYINETRGQELWVCTKNGLYLFSIPGNYTEYSNYLKDKYISGITGDTEGGYWISTIDDGLYYLVNSEVKNFLTDEKLKSPLVFTCSKSSVYAGYFSGSLARVNTNGLNFILKDTSDKCIDCLFYDTTSARLYIGNSKLRYIENEILYSLKVTTAGTCNIGFVRNKENIFSGAFTSLVKIVGDSTHREADLKIRINCIFSGEKDELFLGCIDGAYRYDAMNKSISLISPQFKDVRVDDIESMDGNIFFATQGKGLMSLRRDGTIKTIDESQGLCSNIIRKFRVSGNKIWCASFNGMSEIAFTDLENFEFNITNISANEGLLNNEINDIATLNDTVWVASKKGISFFSSHTDFVNHHPPIVHFTTFQVNSIDTTFKDDYLFPHNLNTISIGFESPLFKSSGKQLYQYTLINADDSIKGLTTNRSVQFLSLRPGTYVLNVKAMNNSGVWSVQPATLHFSIRAPWWQTWWFRIFIMVLVIASGISFYKIRLKKLSNKFDSERKQASLQLTAMRAQMNPHFIFNVMSSIRHYMQHNDMASAEKYLTSFAKLVRYTLDNSATQEVTLAEELQALNSYVTLEMQRVENGFDFEVQNLEDLDLEEIMVPSLLLQPFVENAIKHGIERSKHKNRILVEIKKHGETVLIAIEDNGVGRNNALQWNVEHREKHTSFGTRLTFDRIESFNLAYNRKIMVQVIDLEAIHSDTTGTRVEIVL